MQKSKQDLPVGYQLPDSYANHPQVLAREKFMQTEADLNCLHYPNRLRYFCALCTYEFYEKNIKERVMAYGMCKICTTIMTGDEQTADRKVICDCCGWVSGKEGSY